MNDILFAHVRGPSGQMFPVILNSDFAEDFDPSKWRVFFGRDKVPYVHAYAGCEKKPDGGWKTNWVHLQRVVNVTPKGLRTDHRNGNTLDNRRENLRNSDQFQNGYNCKVRKDSGSGLRGVKWYAKQKKWGANIKANKKNHFLGLFSDKYEAAAAYNEAAKTHHGEFARLNHLPLKGGSYS